MSGSPKVARLPSSSGWHPIWPALRDADFDAVIVSHGGPLRIAMALALRVPARSFGPIEPATIVRLPVDAER
jgi:broad specificity phosphatase PhoE